MAVFWHISEKEYNERLKEIKENNQSKERKRKLKEEKNKYKNKFKIKFKPPSTSKLILLGVFLLCLEIIIFSEYAMIVLGDTSAMYTLIGIPVTLIPTILSYYNKSKAENTQGGIVYEASMKSQQHNDDKENLSDDDAMG